MAGKTFAAAAFLLAVIVHSASSQSKGSSGDAIARARHHVAGVLGHVDAASSPSQALSLLRECLSYVESQPLPRDERLDLSARLEERIRVLQRTIEDEDVAKAITTGAAKPPLKVAPLISVGGSLTVTPTVSADRRFVRLGFSGTMMSVSPGPIIPVHVAVPSVYYGPGKGFTVGRPESIKVIPFSPPRPTFFQISGGTATVPDGGFASLGSYSSSAMARSEFGVPGLGHLPYAGRLFRNVGYGQDKMRVSVGFSARIISLEEEEERFLAQQGR